MIASTASPFKFNRVVLSALGEDSDEDDFALTERLREKCHMEIPASLCALRGKERRFTAVTEKEKMYSVIRDFLQVEEQLALAEKKAAAQEKVQKETERKEAVSVKAEEKKEPADKTEKAKTEKSVAVKTEKKPVRRPASGGQTKIKPPAEKKTSKK